MSESRTVWRLGFWLIAAAVCLAVAPATSRAESAGRVLFATYCASCHGLDARGNGPVASSLVTPPADLTQLARRHGVPLSRDKIAEYIDGRVDVLAHGPREMPIWGERFAEQMGPQHPNIEQSTKRTIDVIVDYLFSIQGLKGT